MHRNVKKAVGENPCRNLYMLIAQQHRILGFLQVNLLSHTIHADKHTSGRQRMQTRSAAHAHSIFLSQNFRYVPQ